jgi:Methyltransferase domain
VSGGEAPSSASTVPSRWGEADRAAVRSLACFAGPALPWSDWAMRPTAIALLVAEVERGRRNVVELGSGVSTIVLARAAHEPGARVVSIEHDRDWAAEVRRLLRRERLEAAEVIDVPLAPLDPAKVAVPSEPALRAPGDWYGLEALHEACPYRIDLLIVDGPPADRSPDVLVRAPALAALEGRLAEDCTVALDDVGRRAEKRTAELWAHALGCQLELPPDTDLAVLRR